METIENNKKAAEEQLTVHRKQNEVLLNRNEKLIKDLSASEAAHLSISNENKNLK
jgi:hypothetical protein